MAIKLPPDTPDALTTREVGEIWNASGSTVTLWALRGKLRAHKGPGGNWRFRREDVQASLNGQGGGQR